MLVFVSAFIKMNTLINIPHRTFHCESVVNGHEAMKYHFSEMLPQACFSIEPALSLVGTVLLYIFTGKRFIQLQWQINDSSQ